MGRTLLQHRFPYIAVGLLSLLPLLALATPTPSTQAPQPHIEKRGPGPEGECGFQGDDNAYGLGIRIGIYLQWVTSVIAYGFVPDEAVTLRGVNNCFQVAMFAGLLFVTIKNGHNLHAVEAYIMLIFCMGGVYPGDSKTEEGLFKPKRFSYYRSSTMGGFIRFFLSAAFCVYGVWFFFTGMDNMKHPPCSTFAFFYARVNLYHWIRIFMKALFLIMALIHAIVIFCPVFALLSCLPALDDRDSITGEMSKESSGINGFLLLSGSLVSFILTVEFMIKWNNISGVNEMGSTGQLLPLVVAISALCRVLHRFFYGGAAVGVVV